MKFFFDFQTFQYSSQIQNLKYLKTAKSKDQFEYNNAYICNIPKLTMPKGVSIKFTTYEETLSKILRVMKLDQEIKKHSTIIIKPTLTGNPETSTPREFVEPVLEFCLKNKNPVTDILIADGSDGHDTLDLFESSGYNQIAEKYGIGLLDLNTSEIELIGSNEALRFEKIYLPKILREAFIITLPKLHEDESLGIQASLSSVLGFYPAKHYKGFFTSTKSKLHRWPIQYAIHDMLLHKMPNLSIVDASDQGFLLAGQSLAVDKQGAKLLGFEWEDIAHIYLVNRSLESRKNSKLEEEHLQL